ncbi:hypothetical protein F383_39183 [Gossypium arboreum]|uniref:Uncharacterized protein n=1 Tax=Gossypium arboreum TaxID=29729 RepID=A0A0B0MJW3_GOSAR|nr:hypothetical protein F383_39183 [Gossypium arboreum]
MHLCISLSTGPLLSKK